MIRVAMTSVWWQFFQIFVYSDVLYAQTWEVLTLKMSHLKMNISPDNSLLVSFDPETLKKTLIRDKELINFVSNQNNDKKQLN